MPCSTVWLRSISFLFIANLLFGLLDKDDNYFVARIPPTTFVITNFPSRSNQRVATSSIDLIRPSYSSCPLNMEVHNRRSSLNEARTYSINGATSGKVRWRSEEHTSELQSQSNLVCRLLLEKKKKNKQKENPHQNKQNNNHTRTLPTQPKRRSLP